MAYKINDLTALGRNLGATDELEVSLTGATGSRKITGAQIIAAAGGVSSVTGTSPIVSSGGSTPAISINVANASQNGYLSSTDWNTFNGKQAALGFTPENVANKSVSVVADKASDTKYPSVKSVWDWVVSVFQPLLVSGSNIKTINGSSVLGSGNLVVGGGGGIHALIKPQGGIGVSSALTPQWTNNGANNDEMIFYPFIPAQSFTSTNLSLWVSFGSVGATFRALIYSDLNGLPNTKLFESTTIDGSTSGLKTITNTFNFVGGTTYWLCYHSGVSGAALVSINAKATYTFAAKKTAGSTAFVNSYYLNFALGSAPTTATIIQNQTYNQALPNININV